MMGIRAVIFDLGGVLVRTEDHQPRSRLAEELNLSYAELDKRVFANESSRQATVGRVTEQEHWKTVQQEVGMTDEQFSNFVERFFAGDRLDHELVDTIRKLRPRYRTALLSNAWDNLRAMLEGEWRIADAFDEVFISAEMGIAKPDSEIYLRVLERLELQPPQAVFVDDFIENVEAARQAGLHAIHFRTQSQALAELFELLNHTNESSSEASTRKQL